MRLRQAAPQQVSRHQHGQPSDEQTVTEGDTSFGQIVPTHLPAMLRVAAALVGSAEAEDAAQEAVIRAWKSWAMLRESTAARAWLLRITVNVCHDWLRGRFGKLNSISQPLPQAEDRLPIALLGLDPGNSDHTGALDLRQAINQLDKELRITILLRYYADMDATEIGATLDIPPATVRSRLRRARDLLREQLTGTSTAGNGDKGHSESNSESNPKEGGR